MLSTGRLHVDIQFMQDKAWFGVERKMEEMLILI